MKDQKEVSRREFIKKTALGTVVAAGISAAAEQKTLLLAQEPASTLNRHAILSALGDTLIPSTTGDPGYKNLEWYGITDEVLKQLSKLSDGDLRLLEESSKSLFDGKRFLELDEDQRADYLRLIIEGSKFADKTILKALQDTYRTVRRNILTLFYDNFPQNRVPRDANDIPVLKPGDTHQITNPNTGELVTGWDIARFGGPLTWEEERQRREYFRQIDWREEPGGAPESDGRFQKQEDFAKALFTAGRKGDPNSKYDVVIVGAGLSGCILAARIAEKGVNPTNGERLKVALIEWGQYLKGDARPGYGHPLRRLLFTNVSSEFREKGRYANPWGFAKIVGGSSMHFGAQAFHPFHVDFLHWRNETGVDWTEEEFQDSMKEVDTMFNVHPLPEPLITVGQRLWGRAAQKLGYSPSRLAHARENCIHCALGCADGQMCKYDSKRSALVTYVPIAERNGVEIIPNTKVEKVIIEKRGSDFFATGVWADQDGKKVRFLGDKVILSASVNANPWILYNSGYGPKEVVGKDLIVENPNVGRHVDGKLRGPSFPALFPFPIKEGNRGMPAAYYCFQGSDPEGYDRLVFKEGIADTEVPGDMALSEFAPEFGWEHKQFMKMRGDQIASNVSLQYLPRNAFEGHIERDGNHVFSVKDPQYAKRLLEGAMIVRDLYREMGAVKIANIDRQLKQLESFESSKQASLPTTHQSCSCRAGTDRRTSVINQRFESHDIRNLFMCDLSSPPRVTLGNPGICMVAHVANFGWRRIVKDHFSRASMTSSSRG